MLLEVCRQEGLKYRGVSGEEKKKRKEKFHARRNKRLWEGLDGRDWCLLG